MLATSALASIAWPFSNQTSNFLGTPGFCIPTTGPFSFTLSAYFDDIRPSYNQTGKSTQVLRRDRTLQVERQDTHTNLVRPRFESADLTFLINYKQNAQWTITRDESGKTTCIKQTQPPGPQPTGADCIDVTAVSRGT